MANDNPDPGLMPMRITDATSMLRRVVSRNEKPFIAAVYKFNNSLIDEWETVVLKKISDSKGCIRAGQVWAEWNYFYDGKYLPTLIEGINAGTIVRPPADAVKYWVDIFTRLEVEELVAMHAANIGHGWKLIMDETFVRTVLEKWDLIYSKSTDPLEWRKLANENPKFWKQEQQSPFWSIDELPDILEKIKTILGAPIVPLR
jgi:hypothetical protein